MKLPRLSLALALLGLLVLAPLMTWAPGHLAFAEPPPGTTPPTIDGLLDLSYIYDGRTVTPDTPGKLYHHFTTDSCYYALAVDRAFNDNVFGPYDGTTADGWNQHRFKHLETSDGALFAGAVPGCQFNIDYLDRQGSPLQWCSGTCGDAYYMEPAGCTTIEAATSMYYNATQSDYGLAHFDPAVTGTDAWISPPLDYSCVTDDYYEWNMIYEFRVPKPAEGCGALQVASSHNSPAKAEQHLPGLARIGNFVWFDENRNGMQDDGGGGMRTVCMYLKQAGPDGLLGTPDDVQVGVTHTDREGEYWFDYLQPGTYYVDPGGVCIADDFCHTLNLDQIPNDNGSMNDPPGDDPALCEGFLLGTGDPFPITVAVGETYPKADFGYDNSPTAVDLLWFKSRGRISSILVGWETASELDNVGFNIYRGEHADGPKFKINEELIPTLVPPGSPFGAVYKYRDTTAQPGVIYYYWLEDLDISGKTNLHGPEKAKVFLP